ncbi:MAG TPA: AAA family ATPase [Gaiellaceae bacterium]|jgi:class 3 adenylate cyclase
MSACPSCGHENAATSKFCSECGAALAASAPAARTERKILTVLFADLVGFTSRAEQLDPEDVQAVLAPYHERLRYELERWGGTVEKFIGDAVMALFGAPVSREDDPERAVRAALAIRDWIVEEGELQVRIAVNTGEALVNLAARPEAGEGMAAGDVVNTAARLQSSAPVNGILVGEMTYRATAETIDYYELPAVEAKGKEAPIPVWEVVQARARFGVDLTPEARTQLVGREREVEQLVGALERARRQRSTELVTVAGVPGIGKSRMVGELFQSIERGGEMTYWRQGRCLPYGQGVSYWALAEMVKAQASILDSDSDDEVEAKLTRTVEPLIDDDAEWVLAHLRPLVGQASDGASGSQEEAFAAWRRFFEALAEQRPIVLVFEDIQWADDGLLDFIEHLVDWARDVPMLILCTARLELLERRSAWGGGKLNAAIIPLAPLSNEETAKLIASLSERALLEAETQSVLLERAGGNPLYAEQFVRMLAERGSAEELPLPETVQGIIAARLDSLASDEKALLQDAAVIGKVFWLGVLDATEQQLQPLRQKEFVQRARRSSVEGETEYAFKHALVRDVAYGQIPRAERSRKHLRAAEWIESLGRPEDHAEMVAHHYVNALELARASGQDDAALVDRVRAALRDAGDRAMTLNALPQAEAYFRQALDLSSKEDPERPALLLRCGRALYRQAVEGAAELSEARRGLLAAGDRESAAEALLMLADIAWSQGLRDEMVGHLEEARALVEGTSRSRIRVAVLCEVARYEMLADRLETARELGGEALRLAEELGFDDLRAHVLNTIGSARAELGDREGFAELEESIALATRLNSIPDMLRGHNNVTALYILKGDLARTRAAQEKSLELARHFGHRGQVRFIEAGAAVGNRYLAGEWDDALERAESVIAEAEAGARFYALPGMYAWRGLIRLARGDAVGAESDAELTVELARPVKDPQALYPYFAMAGTIFLSVGNRSRAGETLGETVAGLADLPRLGFAVIEFPLHAWVAEALGRASDLVEVIEGEPWKSPWLRSALAVASGDFIAAADILGGMGIVSHESFFRLRAAERLVDEGRRAEADEQLPRALAFYRSVGATRYVREGEALLAASA